MAYKKLIYIFACTASLYAFAPGSAPQSELTLYLEECLKGFVSLRGPSLPEVVAKPEVRRPAWPSKAEVALPTTFPPRIGQYKILGVIGKGGFGTIYLGQTYEGVKVAIKVLENNNQLAPAVFEGAVKYEVQSQHKAREIDRQYKTNFFVDIREHRGEPETGGRRFMVTDFVPASTHSDVAAPSLKEVFEYMEGKRGGSADEKCRVALGEKADLNSEQLQNIWAQASRALGMLHQAGVVHADFKPENILLTRVGKNIDGTAKFKITVVDFGNGTPKEGLINPQNDKDPATPGQGSPLYMHLDQWQKQPSSSRWDKHAAGVWYQAIILGRTLENDAYHRTIGGRDIPEFKPLKLNASKDGLDVPFDSKGLIEQSIYATVPIAETHQEWNELVRTSKLTGDPDRKMFYGNVKRKFQEILERKQTYDYHPAKEVARRILSHEGLIRAQAKGYLLENREIIYLVRAVMYLKAESQMRMMQGMLMHHEVSEHLLFNEFIQQVYLPLVRAGKISGDPDTYFGNSHPEFKGLLEDFRVTR